MVYKTVCSVRCLKRVDVCCRQRTGTWRDVFTKDYWKEWFIPPDTDGEEVYKKVKDPTLEHDGYQQAAWEEEAEILYVEDLQRAEEADLDGIRQQQWLSVCCNDINGSPVVLVCPEHIDGDAVQGEKLYQHFIATMDKVADAPYSVLVAMAPGYQHLAGQVLALRPFYERHAPMTLSPNVFRPAVIPPDKMLPVKYKLRLSRVMLMFANRGLRASMLVSCPFFSHSFWGKCMFIQNLEDLWRIVDQDKIYGSLPEAVKRAAVDKSDATQELSDLSQMEESLPPRIPGEQALGNMPEVC